MILQPFKIEKKLIDWKNLQTGQLVSLACFSDQTLTHRRTYFTNGGRLTFIFK